MKILRKKLYNNGYGCSCCRHDWEETDWIEESEMIPFDELLRNKIKDFNESVFDGGQVGVIYQKDGEDLYGLDPSIYRTGYTAYAVIGDALYSIKEYEGVHKAERTIEELIKIYNKQRE